MRNCVKNWVLLVSLFLAAGWGCTCAEAADVPVISVDGTGVAEVVPDQASIVIGITTTGRTAQEAQAENAGKAQAIQAAVQALGVEQSAIRTRNYSFHPDYEYKDNGKKNIRGYTASNSIVVRVDDVLLVGKLVDAALRAGANQIDSLEFGLKHPERLRQQALAQAVNDARDKANALARALGVSIVGVQAVSESSGDFSVRNLRMPMVAMSKMEDSAATPIEAGELKLTANVHIDFLIAQ